ncbi:aminopeptidase [Halobacillus litoralis]
MFSIVRIDRENPVAAWDEHNKTLIKARGYLNSKHFL